MAEKRIRNELFVATKAGFVSGIGRVDIGDVAVGGHVVLRRAGGYFRPLVPRFGTLAEDSEPEASTPPVSAPAPAPAPAPTVTPRADP